MITQNIASPLITQNIASPLLTQNIASPLLTQNIATRIHETNNVNQPRRLRQGLSRLAHRVAEAGPRGAEATLGAHASPLGRLPATED